MFESFNSSANEMPSSYEAEFFQLCVVVVIMLYLLPILKDLSVNIYNFGTHYTNVKVNISA